MKNNLNIKNNFSISKIFDDKNNFINDIINIAINKNLEYGSGYKNETKKEGIIYEFTCGGCFSFALEVNNFLRKKGINSDVILILDKDLDNNTDYLIHSYIQVGDKKYDINGEISYEFINDEYNSLSEMDEIENTILKTKNCTIFNSSGYGVVDYDFCIKNKWYIESSGKIVKEWLNTIK